jgi:hypothetical protein
MKTLAISFVFFVLSSVIVAQQHSYKGSVKDAMTGEAIIGAVVGFKGTKLYTTTELDGSFIIKNIPSGEYELEVRSISFKAIEKKVKINSDVSEKLSMQTEDYKLEEVTVVGRKDETSEMSARATEKLSMNVKNVISEKEIEVSPDITVANVVQRVSGVSLERNSNGDGQFAIVRGMDKRYNYTLVNGIKIPSPDPRNRYVPLDIFPSDLLERLEVTKALTPNMEGDAIGGVIDMKMKRAPEKFTVNFNAGTGYNQLFVDQKFRTFDRSTTQRISPRNQNGNDYRAQVSDFPLDNIDFRDIQAPLNQIYGLSVGDRFLNGKLGVLVAGSYQNTYRGANSLFMTTFVDQETNLPYFEIVQNRVFSTQQQRGGVHARLDYEINKNHKIDLYLGGIMLNDFETRTRTDTILKIGRGQGPGTGRIELRERSRQRYQNIYNGTLQGNHQLAKRFKMDWSAAYSLAKNDDPDMAQIMFLTAITKDNQGNINQDPINYGTDYSRRWINNSDQDLAGYLNTTYSQIVFGVPVDFSVGGMYRHKDRESFSDNYLLRAMPIIQEWSGSIRDGRWNLFNPSGTSTEPLNYECTEDVAAGYGMLKANIGELEILTGARIENTNFSWISAAPDRILGKVGNITYMDVLPSLHLKYKLTPEQNIRLTYFKSISRPSFFEVIPYEINEDDFRERGNPFLSRTSADNIDLRYEYFGKSLDKFMIGGFYKNIQDPIESALLIQGQNVFLQPNNFGTAQNFGIEVDAVKYIKKFGFRAFYTFTWSEITTTKLVRFRDANGNLTSRTDEQTRPLQGQSRHISNVSLLYKNSKTGTDAQLAMVYTGRRIITVSPYLDNDIWQRGFVQLDFSFEQRIKKNFTIYLKINNIIDSPLRADIMLPNTFNPQQAPYLDSSKNVLVREDFYRQTYLIGLRYKFVKV